MKPKKLTAETKDIFSLIAEAAFVNPFSAERVELDRRILEMALKKGHSLPKLDVDESAGIGRGDGDGSDKAGGEGECLGSGDAGGGEFVYGDLSGLSWGAILPLAVEEVGRVICELEKDGAGRLGDFCEEDQKLVERVFLFDVFHKFVNHFDQLIIDQREAGAESLEVGFANDAIRIMVRRGFSALKAKRYFALFYQMRRAFYFIHNGLVGNCESMRRLRMNLWNNIFTHDIVFYEEYLWDKMEDFSTLLLGPTGSGKGAAAAAIGMSGFIPFDVRKMRFEESFAENFISINLSQYPESLIESELFGHKKGSFTGAVERHEGIFAMCSKHGSIFLDEIGDVGAPVQIKLLQVLQDRVFSPVGSHEKLKFQGRVIAATNRSVDQLRLEGKFRDDFYYRLCSDCIEVPSLQMRIFENRGELDELVGVCVERIAGARSKKIVRTVKEVIGKKLGKNYHWPGNVRELAQCVRRVIIKRDYEGDKAITRKDTQGRLFGEIEAGTVTGREVMMGYCYLLYQKFGTYEQVSRITELDRRTVKKYILQFAAGL